jgi:sugar phosphate isomerase/epimerase
VNQPRHWINCGQAGPLGWTIPAAIGVKAASPNSDIVAISGDYDFQFMIEELAVAAQFKVPYIHVVVNNSYLGLIRQAQRGFEMDYCVQLAFDNINAPELEGYGVDHVKVVEGLGCKAIRVFKPEDIAPAFAEARDLMAEFSVPVVVEVILERVTNIAMGTEIDNINEFEPIEDLEDGRRFGDPGRRDHGLSTSTASRSTPPCPLHRGGCGGFSQTPRETNNAKARSQPDDAVQRSRLPGPLRGRRPRRLPWRGVPVSVRFHADQIADRLNRFQLDLVLHNLPAGNWEAGERGIACHPDRVGEFQDGVGEAIKYAKVLGVRQLNCLVGILPQNVKREQAQETLVENLRFAANALAQEHIDLLIEPINTFDIPGFFLSRTQQAIDLMVRSTRPTSSCSTTSITCSAWRARSPIRSAPTCRRSPRAAGRQPRPQRARHRRDQLPFLFRFLDEIGYQGWIGCEYKPKTTTEAGLGWRGARRLSRRSAEIESNSFY